MKQIRLDAKREGILAAESHVLIEGGPGSGKTTIALLKAKQSVDSLEPEQKILFLSFSRAAVKQVTDRMAGVLSREDGERIEVRTFHSFFLDVIRSHGRLLTGKPALIMTPGVEAQRRAYHEGDWAEEKNRLARVESIFAFGTLAPAAASLLERSVDVRNLYNARYPLVIVDEFQDTDRDQWRVIKTLSDESVIVCLADPDQRIFEYLEGVDEYRLTDLRNALRPSTFDLSADNHRSRGGILEYANAVLRNEPMAPPSGVAQWSYQYEVVETRAHQAVVKLIEVLTTELGVTPTLAVLTRTNGLAARVSENFTERQTTRAGEVLPKVDHVLAWDPDLATASALVIASILEWPIKTRIDALIGTLGYIADFYRTKLGKGTKGAKSTIQTIERAIRAIELEKAPASKTAKLLLQRFAASYEYIGNPVRDWQVARARLHGSKELDEIFRQARWLRLLRATDGISWALIDAWDGKIGYLRAVDRVRTTLTEEAINPSSHDPSMVSLMTMHKSKGKEFDGVVIVEDRHQGPLLSEDPKQHDADRRLLRVAITRARHIVVFVRPVEAHPLVSIPD